MGRRRRRGRRRRGRVYVYIFNSMCLPLYLTFDISAPAEFIKDEFRVQTPPHRPINFLAASRRGFLHVVRSFGEARAEAAWRVSIHNPVRYFNVFETTTLKHILIAGDVKCKEARRRSENVEWPTQWFCSEN